MVGVCTSGQLVLCDRHTRQAFEPSLDPSIAVGEDQALSVSGQLWVRGGIRIESAADGHVYETRNRVTLGRCGHSRNEPFCDGNARGDRLQGRLVRRPSSRGNLTR
jgi:Iron-binding zinc finger CDGSH type